MSPDERGPDERGPDERGPDERGPDERGPRERMVVSTVQLMRRSGVANTGMRDVVEHAQAPRGSLQHYFPGGKEQLVNEAVDYAGRYASRRVERVVAGMSRPTPSRLFAGIVQKWIDEYRTHGFEAGCPVAAATMDWADEVESTRRAAADAFDTWRRPITAALVEMGVPARRAAALATLMVSALEGAILLARAERDVAALHTVVRELGPLLDGGVRSGP